MGQYKDWADCIARAPEHVKDKEAYCGSIKHRVEDKMSNKLLKDLERLAGQVDSGCGCEPQKKRGGYAQAQQALRRAQAQQKQRLELEGRVGSMLVSLRQLAGKG